MPIYEYKCAKCGAEFELLVRRDTVPACPECRSEEIAKRMSAPSSPRSNASDSSGCNGACGAEPHSHSCGCSGGCCCGRH